MPWSEGDVHRCPDPACGCEVTVTKGPNPGLGGDRAPACWCGKTMERAA